jgi:hypothetical protein
MTALSSPSPSPSSAGWNAHQRARALSARRDRLRARLPRRIAAAAELSADMRAWIVDDAIEFASVSYEPAITSQPELERVFWDAAAKRVARAREGRYDLVRAGYQRADLAALEQLAVDATPEDRMLARAELSAALHFAAVLEPRERAVFLCQARDGGERPAGAKRVARELGLSRLEVVSAQRSIHAKHERFATICAAGRLCGYLAPALAALAAGDPDATGARSGRELAARVHLEIERCPTCTADYARQLRYLRGARFHHQVAALLPAGADARQRTAPGAREWLPDWAARLLSYEPASTTGQLVAGGAGRGLGGAVAVKLASLCLAGAGTLGACLATGVLPLKRPEAPVERATPTPAATPRSTPVAREPRLPHGAVTATPTATPTPRRTRPRTGTRSSTTQGGTGARSHEQPPASPAPVDAAPGGASEFDPTYQSSTPAAPAPVPAAPGAGEFP